MTEINPYESPQSSSTEEPEKESTEGPFPSWLGKGLRVQFALVIVTMLAFAITITPEFPVVWDAVLRIAVVINWAFAIAMMITAVRYRLGWLLVLELIVLVLPILASVM